jgi:cellulose synthase operon protein C
MARQARAALALVIVAAIAATVWAQQAPRRAAARHLYLTGKYAEAVEAYQALAADDPANQADDAPVETALGLARCHAERGELDAARAALTAALVDRPQSAPLDAELAGLMFGQGKYDEAREHAEAALAADANCLPARWWRAELDRAAGNIELADAGYKWFVDFYNDNHEAASADDLHWIGLAAAQFARWHRLSGQFSFLVNELYPDALKADADFWPAHLASGMLFLEKYNQPQAARELNAALKINAQAAETHAALGALAMRNYQLDEARRHIDRALVINPRLISAHQSRADLRIVNFEAAEAIELLEAAKRLNPRDEQTLGRLAAAYAVVDGTREDPSGTRMGEVIAEVERRNPHAGEFYHTLAASLDLSRRFPAAAKYYQTALDRLPQLTASRGELGLMHMRLGDEAEAQRLLTESFKVDPFNVRVANSLKVLEVLDDYAVLETEHFVLKFDRGQDELLARYASRYLEHDVYPALVKKFGFEPPQKSLFEIFSRARNTDAHGWFSARMVGLPYVSTVGACAGKVVAITSPNDLRKKFNWARVLKHEFVHVLNLQQTDFNVPHWFTEALAVETEGHPRPETWNQLLRKRVPKGELFNLDTINLGFIRPTSSLDWQMAYCQAQLYAQYMLRTRGDDALAKMLAAYADNLDTRAALRREFGIEQQAFEAGYREFLDEVVAELSPPSKGDDAPRTIDDIERALVDDPANADLLAKLAEARFGKKQLTEARRAAEQAVELEPKQPLAAYVLARLALAAGESERAIELLQDSLDRERPHDAALNLLAALKIKADKPDEAAALYELAALRQPHELMWLKLLARLYLAEGGKGGAESDAKLTAVLTRLATSEPDDFIVRKKLAQLSYARDDFAETAHWAEQANQIDVMDADIHRLWADALAHQGEPADAAAEYDAVVRLKGSDVEARLSLARAYLSADQRDKARAALAELLKRSPDHTDAKQLAKQLATEDSEEPSP